MSLPANPRIGSAIPAIRARKHRRRRRKRLAWRARTVTDSIRRLVRSMKASLSPKDVRSLVERSTHPKRCIDCVKQGLFAEWLEQAFHGTIFEHAGTNGLVPVASDEDDWNVLPAKLQLPLEIGPGHAGHDDIEDQTAGLADAIRREELFRRRKCPDHEAERPEQVG